MKFKWPPPEIADSPCASPLWYQPGHSPDIQRVNSLQPVVGPLVESRGVAGSTSSGQLFEADAPRLFSGAHQMMAEQYSGPVSATGIGERNDSPQPTLGTLASLAGGPADRLTPTGMFAESQAIRQSQQSPLPHLQQRKAMVAVETAAALREGKVSDGSVQERLQQLDQVGEEIQRTIQQMEQSSSPMPNDACDSVAMPADAPSMVDISRRQEHLIAAARTQSPHTRSRAPRPFNREELHSQYHSSSESRHRLRWRSISPAIDRSSTGRGGASSMHASENVKYESAESKNETNNMAGSFNKSDITHPRTNGSSAQPNTHQTSNHVEHTSPISQSDSAPAHENLLQDKYSSGSSNKSVVSSQQFHQTESQVNFQQETKRSHFVEQRTSESSQVSSQVMSQERFQQVDVPSTENGKRTKSEFVFVIRGLCVQNDLDTILIFYL